MFDDRDVILSIDPREWGEFPDRRIVGPVEFWRLIRSLRKKGKKAQ